MMAWKQWIIGAWDWKRPFKSLALVYVILAAIAFCFADHLIFQPPVPQYTNKAEQLEIFTNEDGKQIAGFWYPQTDNPNAPVLLWSHGNAEDVGSLVPLHRALAAEGYAILAYDYPGYGLSEGLPRQAGCYQAIKAAYKHLTVTKEIDPARITIVGQSVGSGPACWLADCEDASGLVLISPFLSAFRTATRFPLFPGDRFPNIRRINSIEEPLLVIHGTIDKTIPFFHGEQLHALHQGPKELLPIAGAGHNTIWPLGYDQISTALRKFVSCQQ